MTLSILRNPELSIPKLTSIYLSDISEYKGKQELYERQSPQRLRLLREHALIESAISSNRIEGVTMDPSRAVTVILGKPLLQNRSEEEIQGYRDALRLVHDNTQTLPFSDETIKLLHSHSKGGQWDSGEYRTKDTEIIEYKSDGRKHVRFTPTSGDNVRTEMQNFTSEYHSLAEDQSIHPLISLAAANLDFLCIHPFRDGNGRVSRLLMLLELYHCGITVGRYISLERLIEENKDQYYETLEYSSRNWHEGSNDPWPYINFLLGIFKKAYRLMEERASEYSDVLRGEKTTMVEKAIELAPHQFTTTYIQSQCPGVSRELIRKILKQLKDSGKVAPVRKGPNAPWEKR